MNTVRLMTCDNDFQAHIIQGALENEGIVSVLHNENTSNVLFGLGSTVAGVDIFVYEKDYNAARALLERNQTLPPQPKYCCPHCHSENIVFKSSPLYWLRAIGLALLGLSLTRGLADSSSSHPLDNMPRHPYGRYVCKDCGTRFDQPVEKPKDTPTP